MAIHALGELVIPYGEHATRAAVSLSSAGNLSGRNRDPLAIPVTHEGHDRASILPASSSRFSAS